MHISNKYNFQKKKKEKNISGHDIQENLNKYNLNIISKKKRRKKIFQDMMINKNSFM